MDITAYVLIAISFYVLGVAVGRNRENFEE